MAQLEARAVIAGVDETGEAFASVKARIDALQAQIAGVDKAIAGVGKTTAAVAPNVLPRLPVAPTLPVAPAIAPPKEFAEQIKGAGGAVSSLTDQVLGFAAAVTGINLVIGAQKRSAEQAHERVRQDLAGMDPKEVYEAETIAGEIERRYPSIAQADAQHLARTARTITGTFEEGMQKAMEVAQVRVIAAAAMPHASPEELTEETDKLFKGLEIKNVVTDPATFSRYMNDIAKAINAFGEQVKPHDYFEMMQFGRQATPMLSERFSMVAATILASEMRGSTYGRAVAGFNEAVVGNRFKHTAALGFVADGLIAPEDVEHTKTGAIKGLKPGAHVKGWRLAQTDPDEWIAQYYLPALAKQGITAPADVAARITQDFQNQVSAQLVTMIATQVAKFEKGSRLLAAASGKEGADVIQSKDPYAAWGGLANTIGDDLAGKFGLGEGAAKVAGWIGKGFDWFIHPMGYRAEREAFRPPAELVDEQATRAYNAAHPAFPVDRVAVAKTQALWRESHEAESALAAAGYRGRPSAFTGAWDGSVGAELAREHSRALALSEGVRVALPPAPPALAERSPVDLDLEYRRQAGLRQGADMEATRGAALGALAPAKQEIDVTGKVSIDPNSRVLVDITVRALDGSILKLVADATASATGNAAARVGTSSAGIAPNGPSGSWDR